MSTVTFLFTDVEGSTDLVRRLGDQAYSALLADHHRLLRDSVRAYQGQEVDTQGDAFFIAFAEAIDAAAAALAIQRAVGTHPWPATTPLRVRIGLHTGDAFRTGTGYVGMDVHRAARICAAGYGGQILVSQTTRDAVLDRLPDQATLRLLGRYRLKDLQEPEALYQLVHPELAVAFPPPRSLDSIPNNLPLQLTSFIGRERELADVRRLFSTTRLLTLTGPGGCGKTRLALQAAAELVDEFPDGVWFVELAALTDDVLVTQAVAPTVGVREESGRPLALTLADAVRSRRLLLVLDNCEHLIDASARLTEALLLASPGLRVLTTSREPLGISGESTYRVPSLAMPDPTRTIVLRDLSHAEATRLFIERAATHQPGFKLTDADASAVAEICRALDGLPLAIELAAARVSVLPIGEIAARLDRRFSLLTGGRRTADRRQQTLRATLDWSHDLLDERERILFRRLGAFSGGFTLEAAEQVCANGLPPDAILDLLGSLINKSLVVPAEEAGSVRYRMLETVRAYAIEKLHADDDTADVRSRHRAWFVTLAERSEPRLSVRDVFTLNRLESDHDNLRAAFDNALTSNDAETALRIAISVSLLWVVRGYWTEGRQRLEAALAAAPMIAIRLHAAGLYWLGILAMYQGDYDHAHIYAEAALALRRDLDDPIGVARSLITLGNLAYQRGHYAPAQQFHEQSLALARQTGARVVEAGALLNLGIVADHRGDYQQAGELCQEALCLFRDLGDRYGLAATLSMLGTLASDQGRYEEAEPLLEEALAIQRELRDRRGTAASLSHLGRIARERGQPARAHELYEESLVMARDTGNRSRIAMLLISLGRIAWQQADSADAAARFKEGLQLCLSIGDRIGTAQAMEGVAAVAADQDLSVMLLAAAASVRNSLHAPLAPSDRRAYDSLIQELKAHLGETRFERAWNRGSATPTEEVAQLALANEPPAI